MSTRIHTPTTERTLAAPQFDVAPNISLFGTIRSGEIKHAPFADSAPEESAITMRHPATTRSAYVLLGLLLGTFPPAAIFIRLFDYGSDGEDKYTLFVLCLAMNVVCAFMGRWVGAALAELMAEIEAKSLSLVLPSLPLIGALWAIVTGAAGGFVFFVFGAIFGAIFALPVGALGFLLFASLHRILSHDGMIEAKYLWPLAGGLTSFIVALILSPHVF